MYSVFFPIFLTTTPVIEEVKKPIELIEPPFVNVVMVQDQVCDILPKDVRLTIKQADTQLLRFVGTNHALAALEVLRDVDDICNYE